MYEYFSEQEARGKLLDYLESNDFTRNDTFEDVFNELFNSDYYIIGTEKASEALTGYGVFHALNAIKEYEENNFGEVNTELTDPELVANMLEYIVGERVLNDLLSELQLSISDDITSTNCRLCIATLKKEQVA